MSDSHDKDTLNKYLGSDIKNLSAVVAYLSLMSNGEELVTTAGKIIKIDSENFRIVVDQDVIDKGASYVIGDDNEPRGSLEDLLRKQ